MMIQLARLALTAFLFLSAGLPAALAMPDGFQAAKFQGRKPVQDGDITMFALKPGDCSKRDYGDGRGESDCANGNLRSQIISRGKQKLGQTVEYSMDIWIDPEFRGFSNYGRPERSPLLIAEWQRINTIKNHLYELHLDTFNGVEFEDRNCFGPDQFGEWNRFRLVIRWSRGDDGFLRAECNGETIYEITGQTATPPGCGERVKLQCEPKRLDFRPPVQWQVGPKLGGFGMEYKKYGMSSQFRTFPEAGLNMRVRNLYYGPPRQ